MAARQKWKMYYHPLAANNVFDIHHPFLVLFFFFCWLCLQLYVKLISEEFRANNYW